MSLSMALSVVSTWWLWHFVYNLGLSCLTVPSTALPGNTPTSISNSWNDICTFKVFLGQCFNSRTKIDEDTVFPSVISLTQEVFQSLLKKLGNFCVKTYLGPYLGPNFGSNNIEKYPHTLTFKKKLNVKSSLSSVFVYAD